MATYTKFQQFVEDVAFGVHNFTSDSTCTLKVALCNADNSPSASADGVLADLVVVDASNINSVILAIAGTPGQTTGTFTLDVADKVMTANGAVGPFRYVVIYNDDPTSPADPLICFFDYESEITLASGDTFTIQFNASGLFTIA